MITSFIFCLALAGSSQDVPLIRRVTLDEVVVSANRLEEAKEKVSQSIQLITPLEIRQIAAPSTAELISGSGRLNVQKSQQGGGSPVIRGFEANRIVLLVDGVRMNNLIYRSGHLQNVITLDPAVIEKAELLFGPSSTLYGSDALGGVIHILTKNPELAKGDQRVITAGMAQFRYASINSEKSGHFEFNIGTKKIASFTSISASDFGDLRMGKKLNPFYREKFGERDFYVEHINGKDSLMANSDPHIQKFSAYRQYDVMEKFHFVPDARSRHLINLQYSTSSDIPRYDRLTEWKGDGLAYASWYYGPQQRMLAAYDLKYKPRHFFNIIHLILNYQHVVESRHSRKFGSSDLAHRKEKVDVAGFNLDLEKKSGEHDLRLGVEIQLNQLKSAAEAENIHTGLTKPLDTRYPDGKNAMNTYAIYLSNAYEFSKGKYLNAGFRMGLSTLFSSFEDTSFFNFPYKIVKQENSILSGTLGLVLPLAGGWRLAINTATGFRVPNIDDLSKVFESTPGKIILPNHKLKPERSYNLDIDLSKLIATNYLIETQLFTTFLTDAIITGKASFKGEDSINYEGVLSQVLSNQNKRQALLYGFSASFRAEPSDFYYGSNFSLTIGKILESDSTSPLDHIPPLYGRLYSGVRKNKFSSEVNVLFNGWKALKDYYLNGEDNEQYATSKGMPAWFTLNFRFSYIISRHFEFQLAADNLLDTQYRTFGSGINAPGRNFIIIIRGKL